MRKCVRIFVRMKLREQILIIADLFAEAKGIGRKRVSTIVLNRGSKLDDIEGGADLGTETFEKAMHWFSANWPETLAWPEEILRPDAIAPEAAP